MRSELWDFNLIVSVIVSICISTRQTNFMPDFKFSGENWGTNGLLNADYQGLLLKVQIW